VQVTCVNGVEQKKKKKKKKKKKNLFVM